ncbi:MAG: D-alanyl-D-alanine carboxypeptidase [Clostridiales bacterium]|nr:D-alanyl-D-alanine carboxypeptidase [Candidatus Crickella caballi]
MNYRLQKVIGIVSAVLLAALLILNASILAYAETIVTVGDENTEAPEIIAESALLYSCDLEKTVYSKNADKKYSPYSITKLMTAYLVIKNTDIDSKVVISEKAADDIPTGSTIYLEAGEKVTIKDLLYGALLESGNDAAYALAEAGADSVKDFVKMMNDQAAEWGCTNTHFTNPVGLKDDNHYTTAEDLLIIVKHVFENEEIRKIVSSCKYTIEATNKSSARKLKNNVLLMNRKTPGVLGGKSGTWEEDDAGFALLYKKDSLSAILVLMKSGDKSRISDAKKLFKYAHRVTPGFAVQKGDDLDKVWVRHGASTRLETETADTVYAYPKSGKESDVKTKASYEKLEAPITKGDVVGSYAIYANGERVAETDIVAAEDIEEGWLPSYIYISNRAALIIAAGLLLLIIVLLCYNHRVANRKKDIGKH